MKITCAVVWKPPESGTVREYDVGQDTWLEQKIERPWHREPVVGEQVEFADGDYDFTVTEITWTDTGCTLYLGAVHGAEYELDELKSIGFAERVRS